MSADDVDSEPLVPMRMLHVLVADDNPTNQRLLTALLQSAGHTTLVAENGRQAVEAVMRENFDIILMTVEMPVMDGLQATNRLRALKSPKRDIPIIALTTDSLQCAEQRCQGVGMDGFLSEPLSARALFEAMNLVMAEGRRRPSTADGLQAVDSEVIGALRDFLDPDQLEALLIETLADLSKRIHRLGDFLGAGNTFSAAQEAHDLISVSGNCGAAALSAIARDIERACRQGLLTEASQDFSRMQGIAVDAAVGLKAVRDSLDKS
jgi:CheY-like chemotaxis protein